MAAKNSSPIEDTINEIQDYIDSCKPSAFSSTKIVVNRDEIEALIEELKAKTPEEIKRYRKIISNKEAILADAQAKADSIVAQAKIQTNELVSEHQIMQQAYAQANEVVDTATKQAQDMLDKATRDANEIRTSAIEYTDDLLAHVQQIIEESQRVSHAQNNALLEAVRTNDEQMNASMTSYLNVIRENRSELNPDIEPPIPENDDSAAQDSSEDAADQDADTDDAENSTQDAESADKNHGTNAQGSSEGSVDVPEELFS